ncbi:hypothetical protein BH09ACT13_BH09ACT13_09430 [soil metagenome]
MEPDPSGSRFRQALLAALALVSVATFVALAAGFWIGTNTTTPAHDPPDWARALGGAGSWKVLPLLALVSGLGLALAGRRRAAVSLVAAGGGAGVLAYVAKVLLQFLGADDDGGRLSDYPSAHVATTTAFAGAAAGLVWLRFHSVVVRTLAVGLAVTAMLAMGWARVAEGSHSVLDAVGGAVLAVGWLAACAWFVKPSYDL